MNLYERAYHVPIDNPCKVCGLAPERHWVSHNPTGDLDCKCGVPYGNHKVARRPYIVGIDGEGQGREDHLYTLLAYSNENGSVRHFIEAKPGERLSTKQCLDFILNSPRLARFYAFAFGYDLTKILTDVSDRVLYLLVRPELRPTKNENGWSGPAPIMWEGYSFNMVGTKFVVSKGKKRVVLWDTFKFYQSKFTKALSDWKVTDKDTIDKMREMKDKRHLFDQLSRDDIREYCFDECRFMAKLTRQLIEAHNKVDLTLTSYYGAGSTSGAILKKMGIDKEVRTCPPEMDHAVSCAFAGGRFEHSILGEVTEEVHGWDISAAYPYQMTFLPCLACGKWEYTTKRSGLALSRAALINYGLGPPPKNLAWGPFPFRTETGAIVFASTSGGGWVWQDEYYAAERHFPHVQFRGAWVYKCDCTHKPFETVPKYYLERLRIGKEGPGIVLKLGTNGGYGKLAQSIGVNPPFQSWPWAGMITSGCRAQMLDIIGLHKNPHNLLAIATDGAYTKEKINPPRPKETGTDVEHLDDKGQLKRKPLGGWEGKTVKTGMFFAKPGIYFPLNPSEEQLEQLRARGVGRKPLFENWKKTVDAWRSGNETVTIGNVERFFGIKSCISRSTVDGKPFFKRSELYGQWKTKEIVMSFSPMPKRDGVTKNGRLKLRAMPSDMESAPYKKSVVSEEAIALKMALIEMLEQPDGDDYSEYEGD